MVSSKACNLDAKLKKQTAKALQRWQKQEARIQRKLAKTDSAKAQSLFGNAEYQYQQLEQKLQGSTALPYFPSLDTLNSSLKFLQGNPQLLSGTKETKEKLSAAILKVKGMEEKFQQAEQVKKMIKDRKELLKNQVGRLGFARELKKLDKQAYYYSEQLAEYKALLKNHKKAERKALELLSNSKLFQEFMQKNSYLGQLFSLPGNYSSTQSLTGLQTRTQVQQLVNQQIGTMSTNGADSRQYVHGQMQQAQQQLNQLKDKIKSLGIDGESGDLVMPEFRRNSQKVKSFFRRLEYGFDLQNQRGTQLLPVTTDFAVTVGYKIRDGISAGVGSGYKMGWGSGFRHLKITNQGLGLRSYIDIKAKGSFWISGGFEYSYLKEFEKLTDIANPDVWQKSGLIGISKKYRIAKRKQGNIQLLYDFLASRQIPHGQAIKFRVGYRF
jgi:hypothetical protein